MKLRKVGYGLSLLVSSLLLSGLVISFIHAEGSPNMVDWYTRQPQLIKNFDYSGGMPTITSRDCHQTEVRVSKSLISKPYESHCMVPTSMGLVEKDGAVVQPQGQTTAYPIQYIMGGNPIIMPVPNQPSAFIYSGYSQGPGVVLGLFKQLSNHLELKMRTNGGMYYDVAGQNQSPDVFFRHSNGSTMVFNPGAWSFSENGRYTIIDVMGIGMTRIDMLNLTMQPFSRTMPKTSSGSSLGAATRISEDGKTAVVAYNSPGDWGSKYFKVVNVGSCTNTMPSAPNGDPYAPDPYKCQSIDLLPYMRTVLPTIQSVDSITFGNDHSLNLIVSYRDSTNAIKYANYSLLTNGYQKSLKQYLALGDSYISGEGALSYRGGTDTSRNQCHQSLVSYPYLLSNNFMSFASVACSGAKVQNIIFKDKDSTKQVIGDSPSDNEKDTALEQHMPGYILQSEFVKDDSPEAVTVSIGGNDIGFGQIMEKCVHPLKNKQENQDTGHTCYSSYEDRAELVALINGQFTRWRSLYETLKNDGAAGRRVYVIGYPQVAKVGGDCGLNVQMNAEEIKFAAKLVAYLNGVIQRAANEAGVQYVDTQQAFDGHRLCEAPAGQAAMNGFTITKNPSGKYDFKASYHPNQLGHQMLAEAVAAQTSRLTKPMPAAAPKTNEVAFDSNLDILQNIPKTYRPERFVHIVDNTSDPVADRSEGIKELLSAQEYYTKPGATYNLELHSSPRSLGNAVADANGDLSIDAAIPADVEAGFHTLHIYGTNIFGNLIDIQKVIFVPSATPNDIDGDGVTDSQDNCPLTVQSSIDVDRDNIDDACDPLISTPPVGGPGTEPEEEGIIWRSNAIMPITIHAIRSSGP